MLTLGSVQISSFHTLFFLSGSNSEQGLCTISQDNVIASQIFQASIYWSCSRALHSGEVYFEGIRMNPSCSGAVADSWEGGGGGSG